MESVNSVDDCTRLKSQIGKGGMDAHALYSSIDSLSLLKNTLQIHAHTDKSSKDLQVMCLSK